MITDLGKLHIKRFLAGQVSTMARTMVIGIGNSAAAGTDMRLNCEIARTEVTLSTYDPVEDKLVYKAAIPDSYIGKIYEIGIYSLSSDTINDAPSQLISTFDISEGWDNGTWTNTYTRVGEDSLHLTATIGLTTTSKLEVALDLAPYTPSDALLVAYQASANSTVQVRFETDPTNYFSSNIPTATGYNIVPVTKGQFVSSGAPDWSNITKVALLVTGSGGTATVDFDALSFIDQDYNNPDMVLVARQVLDVPFVKANNTVNEIEFRMNVAVS